MNLDTIKKLCGMIDHTYKIIASYFDSEGKIVFTSSYLREEYHLIDYLEQTDILLSQCRKVRDIKIHIKDLAITWISIPVITGDIIRGYLVLGPFYSNYYTEKKLIETVKTMNISEDTKAALLNFHSIISYYPYKEYVKIIKYIYFYLYEEELDEVKLGLISPTKEMTLMEEPGEVIENNDEMEVHGTYLFERCMLECVRTGNLINLRQVLQTDLAGKAGTMIVGNELRQEKNLFIVFTALVTRAAIEGGLSSETAFSLSDLYIRQIEIMKSTKEINEQSTKMIFDFAGRVHELLKINAYSYYVNQCCDYIQTNVYQSISVNQIAEDLKISPEHLSRIFKHETEMSVIEYIKKVKVKEAKFLLKYTSNTLVEISEKLAFSSQSHFNSVFKSEMGLTPKQYRDKVKIKSS